MNWVGWVIVGIVAIALGVCVYAPFILSGRISEKEREEAGK